jgi:hypothetical protein
MGLWFYSRLSGCRLNDGTPNLEDAVLRTVGESFRIRLPPGASCYGHQIAARVKRCIHAADLGPTQVAAG